MPSSTVHNLLEACREPGCPICRLEQKSVQRYLDNHFYENVNSPRWRNELRASLGFCHEHAWLGVEQRLGDALGYSILYHDLVNSTLKQLEELGSSVTASRRSLLQGLSDSARDRITKLIDTITPRKRCPVCEQRDDVTRTYVSVLVKELSTAEMTDALKESDGLCLPHLRVTLEHIRDISVYEKLIEIQRAKLETLKFELGEFIRKNDYQSIKEGFGKEGDAWLRAIGLFTGARKK